jgi:ABC-2 type transport system ATP-binding protein
MREGTLKARRVVAVTLFVALAGMGLPGQAVAQQGHTATDETVTNPNDGTQIAITIFKPAGAGPDSPAPVVLHSHGWGGSRARTIGGTVQRFLNAGMGVVSVDQRGHGQSGGQAHVQDPTRETKDIRAVIDRIALLDWVLHDTDAEGNPISDDPVLGAIGGSYGGGYQTMTALDELAEEGRTRFNALAPEITWFDLPESLAPQKVVRTAWTTLLYAAGAPMIPQHIHEAFVWGAASGQWPDGTLFGQEISAIPDIDSVFYRNSPVSFVDEGVRIDIPVLLRQGTSDNLFNFNEGFHIFEQAVSGEARKQSYFVAYNGGHVLPNVLPPGTAVGADACSGDFTSLTIEFFRRVFSGESTDGLLPGRYNMTTVDGSTCISTGNLKRRESLPVNPPVGGSVIATAGLGAPLHIPLTEGPVTVTGIPELSGVVTSLGLDARAFFALSVGTSPANAQVIQNNMLPLRRALPTQSEEFSIELPGVVVEVREGQTLFLTVSPVSDLSFGHSSKTPGSFLLSDLEVSFPVPRGCGPPHDKARGRGLPPPCGPKG